ncbi:histidinol-phosphate transaminase [uncultured Clostridium sp.]|uniref:histidinol-phosphate transaminase n=1 Tax=uncultured Clostridium sp. TaxID=59620 RepID=UPI0025D7836D|nr:histidinol-phosphate transaminase [uncultured Clostridium sp.]
MSRFLSSVHADIKGYVPGEQLNDKKYIKLNSNECSMEPSPKVLEVLKSDRMKHLGLYGDPNAKELRNALADRYEVSSDEVFVGNGSDEVLQFIFLTFFMNKERICYPDITYNMYKVLSGILHVDAKEIPLNEDFTVNLNDYINTDRHVILANPNAPTGYFIKVSEIEKLIKSNKDRLVIIDEAYVDYGNESVIPLVKKHDNLIVVHTMSKSRVLAGAHIGYCIASKSIIDDLRTVKFAFNPYNMSDINLAIGTAAVKDVEYQEKCIKAIMENREYLKDELRKLGFKVLDTRTNFIFVTHEKISATEYQEGLKEAAILTRYFNQERIKNYLRISIGTREEVQAVIDATKKIVNKELVLN